MSGLAWFRRDLRLSDNPAWSAATRNHDMVEAVFVLDPRLWDGALPQRRSLLAAHLGALDASLRHRGGRLRVLEGNPPDVITFAAASHDAVYWNNDYTPYAIERDAAVVNRVARPIERFDGGVIHPPGSIRTGSGTPYRVFSPFWQRWREEPWALDASPGDASVAGSPGVGIPRHDATTPAGERPALDRLEAFLDSVDGYEEDRDYPDRAGTSRLSIDLKFGTISPRRIRAVVGESTPGRRAFVRQLCWRDFAAHTLAVQPSLVSEPFRQEYRDLSWSTDESGFEAWTRGMTGYPIVDAAMRQLALDGWIHNRVRMVASSFLVKDLLIDWRRGERWFRRHLLDADVASNVMNWQWVAGVGVDAAPYFRILNPVTQGRRFDPGGSYVRRWIPEIADLDDRFIHAPWEAPAPQLAAAGIELGETYPFPLVDHADARVETLAAFSRARRDKP